MGTRHKDVWQVEQRQRSEMNVWRKMDKCVRRERENGKNTHTKRKAKPKSKFILSVWYVYIVHSVDIGHSQKSKKKGRLRGQI